MWERCLSIACGCLASKMFLRLPLSHLSSIEGSFGCDLLKESDQVAAFLRLRHMEIHIVARHNGVGVGQPLLERCVVPDDVRLEQRRRVGETRDRSGGSAVDILQPRALSILLQGMAA